MKGRTTQNIRKRDRRRCGALLKKGYQFFRPQPGCHKPNSPWPGIMARDSLVSDVPLFG